MWLRSRWDVKLTSNEYGQVGAGPPKSLISSPWTFAESTHEIYSLACSSLSSAAAFEMHSFPVSLTFALNTIFLPSSHISVTIV